MSITEELSSADVERDPFFVQSIEEGAGCVVTNAGRFTIDEAALMMVDRLVRFDWAAWDDRERLDERAYYEICDAFDDLFSITSCVAQINLYQARLLWCLNAEESVGLPRMLDKANETSELAYQHHLATLRSSNGRIFAIVRRSLARCTPGKGRVMVTNIKDWKVEITDRRPCTYSDKLEMLSFRFSYKHGELELLSDVPFENGTAERDLLGWLSEDAAFNASNDPEQAPAP